MSQATAMQDLPAEFNDGRIDLSDGRTFWVATFTIDEGKTGLIVLKQYGDDKSYVMASQEEVASVAADEVALSLLQDLLPFDVADIAALYDDPMEVLQRYLPMSGPQMKHWLDQQPYDR